MKGLEGEGRLTVMHRAAVKHKQRCLVYVAFGIRFDTRDGKNHPPVDPGETICEVIS